MFVAILFVGISALKCFNSTHINEFNINPAERNVDALTIGFHDWQSARIVSGITKILLNEAMGYEITGYKGYIISAHAFEGMELKEVDLIQEVWANVNLDLIREKAIIDNVLTDFGQLGYTGVIGWWVPDYTVANNPNYDLEYWAMYKNPDVVSLFQLNMTQWILDHPEVHDAIGMSEPLDVFSPPICESSPCIDIPSWSSSWDQNFFQSQVRNLNMPFRINFWGPAMMTLINALHAAGEDFIYYAWAPHTIHAQSPGVSITFPKVTDECLLNQAADNIQGLGSSVNCDYPRSMLKKFGRTEAFEHEAAEEARKFMAKMELRKPDMDILVNKLIDGRDFPAWTEDNADWEALACEWVIENPSVWQPWIYNDYVFGTPLTFEQIVMYVCVGIIGVLSVAFVGWKLGFMDGLEAVLFDMMIIYIGKIVMDMFDLLSDVGAYFTAVNGDPNIPMWFNVMYILIVSASFVSCIVAVYFNAKTAVEAFYTRAQVVSEEVDPQQLAKIRARSSLWQGSKGRPRASDINKDEDLEKIWTQEELEFATKRIGDCYIALAIAASEDIPMLGLNVYLMMNYPDNMSTFVYISLFLSIFFVGVRLNQFYKVIMYRKQFQYAQKAHELHERQLEIQLGIQEIAKIKSQKENQV